MDRRTYLSAFGVAFQSGCLGVTFGGKTRQYGIVSCEDESVPGSGNGPDNGAWPTTLHDSHNTGQTIASGPTGCVETQWTWSHDPQAGMSAGPVVADGQVYVPHQVIDDEQFVVLDAETGTKQWGYSDDEYQMVPAHTPTLIDERLFLVDTDTVGSANTQKRETVWYLDMTDHANDPPNFGAVRVANGMAYVGTHTGFVFAFDAETGDKHWAYDVPGYTGPVSDRSDEAVVAARRRGAVNAPLAVTRERVYVSSWNFTLHALDATTGEPDWSFSPGTNNLNAMQAPVVADGEVYVQTKDARLFVLDRKTGQQKWLFDDIGVATNGVSPLVDDESVYVVAGTSTENLFLVALNRDGGSVRWKRSIGPPYQSPVGDANVVYIDYDDGLHAIDKMDGEKKWTLHLNGELAAPATIVDSAVYAADTSGNVYSVW